MSTESNVLVLPHPRRTLNNYFSIFVNFVSPNGPSIFFVITIHQVIWPSPGTLDTVTTPERHALKGRHSPHFSKGLLRTRILCNLEFQDMVVGTVTT